MFEEIALRTFSEGKASRGVAKPTCLDWVSVTITVADEIADLLFPQLLARSGR